jgi:hypothetical protein
MSKVSDIIKNSLNYYDNINNKYKQELSIINKSFKSKESNLLSITKEIDEYGESWKFNFKTLNKIYNAEILGVFNYKSRVYSWSYILPKFYYGDTYLTKRLLNYSLETEPEFEYDEGLFYLKVMFSNSRFFIESFEELEIILAVSAYMLKDNIKFIAKRKVELSEDDFLYYYYIIKD